MTIFNNLIILSVLTFWFASSQSVLDIYIHSSIIAVTENKVGRTLIISNGMMYFGSAISFLTFGLAGEISLTIAGIAAFLYSFVFLLLKNP